jgi:Flp pilus assembly protein TadG
MNDPCTRGRWLRRRRDDRGAVAVEFALVLPFMLLIVFGSIQYGFYFWADQGASDAARKAARLAAVGEYPDCDAFKASIRSDIASLGDEANATIKRSYKSDAGTTRTAADGSDVLIGDYATVTVSFTTYDFNFPFLPFVNDGLVNSTAKARVENLNDGKPTTCS